MRFCCVGSRRPTVARGKGDRRLRGMGRCAASRGVRSRRGHRRRCRRGGWIGAASFARTRKRRMSCWIRAPCPGGVSRADSEVLGTDGIAAGIAGDEDGGTSVGAAGRLCRGRQEPDGGGEGGILARRAVVSPQCARPQSPNPGHGNPTSIGFSMDGVLHAAWSMHRGTRFCHVQRAAKLAGTLAVFHGLRVCSKGVASANRYRLSREAVSGPERTAALGWFDRNPACRRSTQCKTGFRQFEFRI